MLIPELQEFHRLFAQMDILKEKLIKIWSRDTPICENFLGSGTPTPPGVEFWRIKIRFYPPGHRKNEKTTTSHFAGPPFYYVKMQIQKQERVLDRLFDKNEPAADQGAQQ